MAIDVSTLAGLRAAAGRTVNVRPLHGDVFRGLLHAFRPLLPGLEARVVEVEMPGRLQVAHEEVRRNRSAEH